VKASDPGSMVTSNYDYIVATSCWCSMIGSSFVALTTLYPVENRKKVGKSLLFWLSLSDFITSCVYFIQISNHSNGNTSFCKAIGLLGIFFPVSSFLWTDLVAYYLFSVIVQRNQSDPTLNWEARMKYCHLLAWGVPVVIVMIVGLAGKAGKDDGNAWCWIKEDSSHPAQELIWEFIGGKCVEWISCFLVLPFLYAYMACQLHQIEMDTVKPMTSNTDNIHGSINAHKSRSPPNSPSTIQTKHPASTTLSLPNGVSNILNPRGNGAHGVGADSRPSSVRLFGRFYLKMAAVPIVFFCIRFWGSLRVILNYADSSTATNEWLRILVDIFDPSQGFFNAVLFVMLSRDGQRSVLLAFSLFIATCFYFVPGALRLALYLENLSIKKHGSAGNNMSGSDAAEGGPGRFGKYNNNNVANNDLSNPILASTYSAGGYSTNDLSAMDDEIDEYGSSHSFASFKESFRDNAP
jgi:hypothetical protein